MRVIYFACVLFFCFNSFAEEKLVGIVGLVKHSGMRCSGVVVDSTDDGVKILSCEHIFSLDKEKSKLQVNFYRRDGYYYSYPAEVIFRDKEEDLSVCIVKEKVNVEVFSLVDENPPENSICTLYGYSSSGETRSHQVRITHNAGMSKNSNPLVVGFGPAIKGLSGTPFLFKNRICSIQSAGGKTKVYGVGLKAIREILEPDFGIVNDGSD